MNKIRIATIVCWIVSAVVLIGLLIWFVTGSIFGGWFGGTNNWSINIDGFNIAGIERLSGPYTNQGTVTSDATGLDSIRINWVAGEVTVIPHDGAHIQITEYAQRQLNDNERLHMRTDGNTLTIRYTERNRVRRMPPKRLEVLVPRELSDNLNVLNINTVSSAVNVENSSITRFDISSTSGEIDITNINSTTIDLNSTSGAIDITNINSGSINLNSTSGTIVTASVRTDRLDIRTVSGTIRATDTVAATLDTNTTSGRTTASGEFDRVDVNTVSGDATITSTIVPNRLSVSSVSGDANVYIPNEGEITISHSSVSGRFTSDIPTRIQSGAAFSFSSVSGDTSIKALD